MEVHAAVGGLHDAPNPGGLLQAVLAACQNSAVRTVANLLGVGLPGRKVRVTVSVDVRGTIAMDCAVPVGLQAMTRDVHLRATEGTPPELLQTLQVADGVVSVNSQIVRFNYRFSLLASARIPARRAKAHPQGFAHSGA